MIALSGWFIANSLFSLIDILSTTQARKRVIFLLESFIKKHYVQDNENK